MLQKLLSGFLTGAGMTAGKRFAEDMTDKWRKKRAKDKKNQEKEEDEQDPLDIEIPPEEE